MQYGLSPGKKKGNIREGLPAAKIQCIVTGSLPEERNKACPRLANQTIHSVRQRLLRSLEKAE